MKIDILCFKLIVLVGLIIEILTLKSSLRTETSSEATIFESLSKYKNKAPPVTTIQKKDVKTVINSPKLQVTQSQTKDKKSDNFSFAQKEGAQSHFLNKAAAQAKAQSKDINGMMSSSTVQAGDKVAQNYNLLSSVNTDNRERFDPKTKKIGQVWNGWIKYYTYTNVDEKTILTGFNRTAPFYKNNFFNSQSKSHPGIDLKEKEDEDYKWIKDESSFYLTLFDGIISISNSRENKEQTVYDSIPISKLNQIIEQPGFNGALKIIKMLKNQNCFLISSDALSSKWTICLEDQDKMIQLMTNIKNSVIENQRRRGVIAINNNVNLKKEKDELYKNIGKEKEQEKLMKEFGKKNDSDGYWVLIQSWSSCSLACGGGTQTLQRMCVKPNPTSAECKGNALIERKCNEQPCPDIIKLKKKEKETKAVANPIVKVMQFSNRPQQYLVRYNH